MSYFKRLLIYIYVQNNHTFYIPNNNSRLQENQKS